MVFQALVVAWARARPGDLRAPGLHAGDAGGRRALSRARPGDVCSARLGRLDVRAAWSPSCDGAGVDLEVQASASSVGLLRDVEVMVQSQWWRPAGEPAYRQMASLGDAARRPSAALSYDGRETARDLTRLTTLRLAGRRRPDRLRRHRAARPASTYVEMVQPNDVARQIRLESAEPKSPLPGYAGPAVRALRARLRERGRLSRPAARLAGCNDAQTTRCTSNS